jgi:thiamine transport system ATP-binding protein
MPSELSGGQNNRVSLARALIRRKPLLMLDEPFGALGPAKRNEMLDFVKNIIYESSATLLMVTHDPSDAINIADKVVFISDGLISKPTSTKNFFDQPSPSVKTYLGT